MTTTPRVLVNAKRRVALPASPLHGWAIVRLFAWIMVAAGLGDTVLAFIPARFGTPEWEFGTIASSFGALPLISMGFAGILGSALATGRRSTVLAMCWTLLLFGTAVFALFLVFATNIPVALAQVQGDVRLGIMKAIVKTTWLGVIFGLGYLIAGVAGLRYLKASAD